MNILVLLPAESRHRDKLRAAAPQADLVFVSPEELTTEQLAAAEIIIGNPPPDRLAEARSLRWLQLHFTGADAYLRGALPEDVLLTSATGAFGLALAEHTMALLLALMKKVCEYYCCQQRQEWTDLGPVPSLWQAKLLIVGLGDVGTELAQRLRPFGPELYGIRRHRTACPDYLSGLYTLDDLDELLPRMDIVISALPGGTATTGLFSRERLALLRPDAYFLNVGRGPAVDSIALAEALNAGRLAGAAIDVTDPEPLPTGHPLWTARNIIITPHIAGQFHVAETLERIVDIAARNIDAYLHGQPLQSVIDRASGYRRYEGSTL